MKYQGGLYVGVFSGACLIHALTGFIDPQMVSAPEVAPPPPGKTACGKASNAQIDAWITEARKVLKREGIPGSHAGIKRNLLRESGGDPCVVNDWDINAKNGVPSKGLLQVIKPTFEAHKLPQSAYDRAGVQADANKLTDPVANIVTACNYAWKRYGSMDNVNGPY